MKVFDNITDIVRDDMKTTIKRGSKVSMAAACFSMYAYKELKAQLENVEQFRFIFTSPTFVKERAEKKQREFYIPRLNRENSLYGTEFEIKLRNEMTQKAIVKQIAGEGLQARGKESLKDTVERETKIQQLKKQIENLQNRIRKEKQLNVQVKLNAEMKALIKELEEI